VGGADTLCLRVVTPESVAMGGGPGNISRKSALVYCIESATLRIVVYSITKETYTHAQKRRISIHKRDEYLYTKEADIHTQKRPIFMH